MATLRKKGNAYFIDYRVNGRRFRKNVGRSKKIAELALKDLEVKMAKQELGFEIKDGAIQKLIHDFQNYCKSDAPPTEVGGFWAPSTQVEFQLPFVFSFLIFHILHDYLFIQPYR